jgi:hypothetical protein
MKSDWLPDKDIWAMLREAAQGNSQRLAGFVAESHLRCSNPEFNCLVVVRHHCAWHVADQGWRDLNKPPERGEVGRQFVNLFTVTPDGAGWSKLPVPLDCPIESVTWVCDGFVFRTRTEIFTSAPMQLRRAIAGSFTVNGVTEDQIGAGFRAIEAALPPPSPPPAPREPTFHDSVLGDLAYDQRLDEYQARFSGPNRVLEVCIVPDESASLAVPLARARTFVADAAANIRAAASFSCQALLRLKNDEWLQEDEVVLTPEQFVGKMRLQGIRFAPDGSAEYYFEDGDLFWGHCIVVRTDSAEKFLDADLAG